VLVPVQQRHAQPLKHIGHPAKFRTLPVRVGAARPWTNVIGGEAHERQPLSWNAQRQQQAHCAVAIGEATGVFGASQRGWRLVGQHEGKGMHVRRPGRQPFPPSLDVVAVRVQHERRGSSDGPFEVLGAIEVADHRHQGEVESHRSGGAVGGHHDGLRGAGRANVALGRGGADNDHRARLEDNTAQCLEVVRPRRRRPRRSAAGRVPVEHRAGSLGAGTVGVQRPPKRSTHLVLHVEHRPHDGVKHTPTRGTLPFKRPVHRRSLISGRRSVGDVPVPAQPAPVEDVVTLARYPFLPQASPWIASMAQQHGITLDELLDGPMMDPSRARARLRLVETVEAEDGVGVVGGDLHSDTGRLLEVFSFYYARLVVCATRDERLVARWALAEAQRAERLLLGDERALPAVAATYFSVIDAAAPQGRSIAGRGERGGALTHLEWTIGMTDFLEVCPKITGDRWRLANTEVSNGRIRLHNETTYSSSAKVARLLRERIKAAIEEDALGKMSEVTDDLAARLAQPVGMVRNLLEARVSQQIALTGIAEEDWPPCMRRIIADLSQGVNVNHFGRVFLASMASTMELPRTTTVDFFRSAPDFSEGTTSYQVDHVYDHKYTPAGCGKLKVNHNCPVLPGDDRLCDRDWLDHPLKYVRSRQKWKDRQAEVEAGSPPSTG
jgi:DNA primase large subunit